MVDPNHFDRVRIVQDLGIDAEKPLPKDQDGTNFQYSITGSAEADPSQGKISNVSPIGKSLLGKRVGEVTEVSVPSGKIKLEILKIQ